jgi:uncharacterized membrane protein
MVNFVLISLFHVLAGMFLIGMLGCLVVIPITAYRLFKVLFEDDSVDEEEAHA